jgi:hypothetical protein
MDFVHSLPWGLNGWKRRSAILLTRSGYFSTHNRELLIWIQYWNIGGAMFRYLLLCRIKRAFSRPYCFSQCQISIRRSPDNQTSLYNTTVPSTWQGEPTHWASLFFTTAENISRIGTQIKLSRYGFFSTQKLYTSHQYFVIYMRYYPGLLIDPCWYILRVIYYSASSHANIYSWSDSTAVSDLK